MLLPYSCQNIESATLCGVLPAVSRKPIHKTRDRNVNFACSAQVGTGSWEAESPIPTSRKVPRKRTEVPN